MIDTHSYIRHPTTIPFCHCHWYYPCGERRGDRRLFISKVGSGSDIVWNLNAFARQTRDTSFSLDRSWYIQLHGFALCWVGYGLLSARGDLVWSSLVCRLVVVQVGFRDPLDPCVVSVGELRSCSSLSDDLDSVVFDDSRTGIKYQECITFWSTTHVPWSILPTTHLTLEDTTRYTPSSVMWQIGVIDVTLRSCT